MNGVKKDKKFRRYDDLDTRILDLIYNQHITVMALIIKKLAFMAHRTTISKRVKILNHEGFYNIVDGCNPVCINLNREKEEMILKMIDKLKEKWRLK